MKVKELNQNKSPWQTKELTRSFLEGVRGAIPGVDLQLSVMSKIVQVWKPEPKHILDLGCGDGILGRLLLDLFPKARVWFADFSDPMLDVAKEKLKDNAHATILKCDFSTPAWRDGTLDLPFDIIVSGFAIHHQPDTRKKELFTEIFEQLSENGVFLNLEHVSSATEEIAKVADDHFIDSLYAHHQSVGSSESRDDIAKTHYNRPDKVENILASVYLQCQWLKKIGFKDVDCFFKIFELAIFGGRKYKAKK